MKTRKGGKWTYAREYVKCGKRACTTCPHGPYWYAYRHEAGKMYKRYIGKKHPFEQAEHEHMQQTSQEIWEDGVFNCRTVTSSMCWSILGIDATWSWERIEKQYRKLVMEHHPDRGGDVRPMQRINAAFSYLKSTR